MCRLSRRAAGFASLLALMLAQASVQADCCDPPVVSSTSLRPTSYFTTGWTPTTYTVMSPVVVRSTPVTMYEPTALVSETTVRPGLLDRIFGSSARSTTRTYYDVVPTTYVERVPTRYVTSSMVVERPLVAMDPCAVPASSVVTSGSAVPAGAAPRSSIGEVSRDDQTSRVSGVKEPAFDYDATSTRAPQNEEKRDSGALPATAAPAPADDDPTSGLIEPGTRSAYRPAYTELNARSEGPLPGALRGVVVSGADAVPQAGVKLIFSDARQTYRDRERVSDAEGRFEVLLPNGDWNVSVVESDGKLTPYGSLTSSGGRFFDERDRTVSSLRINH